MNKVVIINIVLVVLCAAIYGVSVYFKTRGKCSESASELIAEIEESGLLGKDKMAYVVKKLYELVPPPFQTVFTPERLEILAQEIFDNMKKYALEYFARIDKENEKN